MIKSLSQFADLMRVYRAIAYLRVVDASGGADFLGLTHERADITPAQARDIEQALLLEAAR
jgi:hypothetical protein